MATTARTDLVDAHVSAAPGRVLLVEEDHALRATAADALRSAGYGVTEAAHGAAALAAVVAGAVADVLVTGVLLPGMTGEALARTLERQLGRIPVLYVAGPADAAFHPTAVAGDGLLAKPYATDALVAQVGRLLGAAA
jgi:CheY-like chemotaxis protein